MARLPAGTTPTPHKVRLQRYRKELDDRGGRRVVVDLETEAADALAKTIKSSGKSIKMIVAEALISFAREPHTQPSH